MSKEDKDPKGKHHKHDNKNKNEGEKKGNNKKDGKETTSELSGEGEKATKKVKPSKHFHEYIEKIHKENSDFILSELKKPNARFKTINLPTNVKVGFHFFESPVAPAIAGLDSDCPRYCKVYNDDGSYNMVCCNTLRL